ncbi:gamma-glutamyl phosphate reductase [bacterium BMS3Abin01]|nr:gamma-glutamyl phosphate reductase [bacterium BMS3Abin01]HDY69529.1 glutamate-5-semialdehyde dehydrogenase [Actinomycetota bacterium]
MSPVLGKAQAARAASHHLAVLPTEIKNEALTAMAAALSDNAAVIEAANRQDLDAGRGKGLANAMLDRLLLNRERVELMAANLRTMAEIDDPVGTVIKAWTAPNGMEMSRVRTPIGVIGIVYEARPNVTTDTAGLCIKAGNTIILRGGSEAIHSNSILAKLLSEAGTAAGLPPGAIQFIETTDREAVTELLGLAGLIDLVIARGSHRLIQAVTEASKIPVMKHYRGMCHVYIEQAADLDMAVKIVHNAKVNRPSTCNSAETALVDRAIATELLPRLAEKLGAAGVEVRADEAARKVVPGWKAASGEDWDTEHLDLILSLRVVDGFDQAIEHIRRHHSGLADAIVTEDSAAAERFLALIDSAATYWNASTRLTDGLPFGTGPASGINTDRVYPRGPMGIEEMTGSRFVIRGSGQVRE